MMVTFLVGLVSMILIRTLRKDIARYARSDEIDELERDLGDEYGWKQVHGDVFRPPSHRMLLSAFIGCGAQIIFVALAVIVTIILGDLYERYAAGRPIARGALVVRRARVYGSPCLWPVPPSAPRVHAHQSIL